MNDAEKHKNEDDKKTVTIIINGRKKEVPKGDLSFSEVVALSGLPNDPNTIFTVTYRRGEGNNEGPLVQGESVKVKEGMIFDVTPTNKS
jgi:Multiubiquitin